MINQILISKHVGYYQWIHFRISLEKKPSLWHRFWMKFFLNAIWHNDKDGFLK